MTKYEKAKADKVLEIAKAIPRKVVFLKRGIIGEVLSDAMPLHRKGRNQPKKLNHDEVRQMLADGKTQAEIAVKMGVTKQMVSYIKNKKL